MGKWLDVLRVSSTQYIIKSLACSPQFTHIALTIYTVHVLAFSYSILHLKASFFKGLNLCLVFLSPGSKLFKFILSKIDLIHLYASAAETQVEFLHKCFQDWKKKTFNGSKELLRLSVFSHAMNFCYDGFIHFSKSTLESTGKEICSAV